MSGPGDRLHVLQVLLGARGTFYEEIISVAQNQHHRGLLHYRIF